MRLSSRARLELAASEVPDIEDCDVEEGLEESTGEDQGAENTKRKDEMQVAHGLTKNSGRTWNITTDSDTVSADDDNGEEQRKRKQNGANGDNNASDRPQKMSFLRAYFDPRTPTTTQRIHIAATPSSARVGVNRICLQKSFVLFLVFVVALVGGGAYMYVDTMNKYKTSHLPSDQYTYDAVIVGAGWAGLGAAKSLKESGLQNILILEARDRIGGRTHTMTDFYPDSDDPVELGSEFLYTRWSNEVVDIFDRDHIKYTEFRDTFATFTSAGRLGSVEDQQLISDLWTHGFLEYAGSKSKEKDLDYDTLLSEYKEEEEEALGSFDEQYLDLEHAQISLEYAADTSQLSTRETLDFLRQGCMENDMAVSSVEGGGYGKAFENLASDIADNIQLESVVTAIDYFQDDAVITYSGKDGSVAQARASTVLMAVPLGVLKTNSIKFTPPLPARKKDAIENMGVGALDKFIMYWDDQAMASAPNFSASWDSYMDSDWLGLVTPETQTSEIWTTFLNTRPYTGKYSLTGWIAGMEALAMENLSDDIILKAVMSNLRTIFASDVVPPTRYVMTRWSQDEYTRGAYSFPLVGENFAETAAILGKPVGETLFFAGEHTSTDWSGTTVGAFETGQAAARNMEQVIAHRNQADH